MDELYDIDLSVNNRNQGLVFDLPELPGIELPEPYTPLLPSLCLDDVLASQERLRESVQKASDLIQPTLASNIRATEAAAAMTSGMGKIVESITPVAAMSAVEGIVSVGKIIQDFACPMPVSANVLMNRSAAAADIASLTSVQLSDTSGLVADIASIKVRDYYPEISTMPQVPKALEVEEVKAVVESTQRALSSSELLSKGIICKAAEATAAALNPSFAIGIKQLVKKAGIALEAIKRLPFKILDLFTSISKRFCTIDHFNNAADRIHKISVMISDRVSRLCVGMLTGLRGLAHMLLLRIINRRRRKRPEILELPWRTRMKKAVSKAKINPPQVKRIREFVAKLRHTLLHKHQRISEDSDDMDDAILLPFAA